MSKSEKTPQRPFKKDELVRIRLGCRDFNLHRGKLGYVVGVMRGVSRPVVVMFDGIKYRYQPGDLERV